MVWRNLTVEEERFLFIQEVLNSSTMSTFEEVCYKFNISRQTGYKWFNRFLLDGREGLKNKSKAHLSYPNVIPEDIENIIILIRKSYPTWGPNLITPIHFYLFIFNK